jgi:hypothetical protein
MSETRPPIKVHHHNDHLISFYCGRQPIERYAKEWNWLDDALHETWHRRICHP